MTDSLRTRIAKVLLQNHPTSLLSQDEAHDAADAVIRELGLIEQHSEWPFDWLIEQHSEWPFDGKHRYVTEWETDGE